MTPYAFLAYLKYRMRAYTRHGIHSPFVYGFIEEVLRQPGDFHDLLAAYAGGPVHPVPGDNPGTWAQIFPEQAPQERSRGVLLFEHIHRTAAHSAAWQALSARPDVPLSLDLYRYGLLFFREEFREKQHFILRYPYPA